MSAPSLLGRLFQLELWTVGICRRPVGDLIGGGVLDDVEWMSAGRSDSYLADPLPVSERPGDGFLAESFRYGDRGRIVHVDANTSAKREAIASAHHLSYPFVFADPPSGERLCVPESAEAGETRLYRMDGDSWTPAAVILSDVGLVDPTLFRHDDRYWLFATRAGAGMNRDLELYSSDSLAGPWAPHPKNPVRSDVSAARPAGPLIENELGLFRPAQDCTRTYGGGIAINRIERITETDYAETTVARLTPDPDGAWPDGVHTISAFGDRTLVDGKRLAFHPFAWWIKLRHKAAVRRRGGVPVV